MVGVQDQQDFERALQHRIRFVLATNAEHHVDVVADVVEIVARELVGKSARMTEEERGEGRQLGHQADALHVAILRILDVLRIGIERRQPADRAEQHAHRMCVVAVAFQMLDDVGMDVGVLANVLRPLFELGLVRQLALIQEPRHFKKRRLLGDLFDRISAIAENPLVTVDECDGAAARGSIHERRVVGHHPEIVVLHLDLAKIDRTNGIIANRDVERLPGAVVGD